MRVPLRWLREYVAVPASATAAEVAHDLVRVGLEEEGLHGGDVTGPVVVGQVLEFAAEPQRNGRTIRWCQVDVGEGEPRGIVCGAHNFEVGDRVVVGLPGSVLAGGFAIAARKTYGHVSDGMICSARELGVGDEQPPQAGGAPAGIIRLAELALADAEVGADAIALLGLDEPIVEVNVTPDRGYQLSVRGVAREYAHATGAVFTDPALVPVPAATDAGFSVRLDDATPLRGRAGCDRYVAAVVRGVDAAAPSPWWLRRRLHQAGMRPISLAVDVTNYVMLATGQPLHAFDLARLNAPIVVRRAVPGERLTTLDGVQRTLHAEDLLITDGGGERVLALAGVMGGASSEVSAGTRDLLVEAAHFDPISVARTGRRHKLSTEASRRFERGVDTAIAAAAAELAVRLLAEHGGGEAAAVTDVDQRVQPPPVRMSVDLPNRLVGCDWAPRQVVETLVEIGCEVAVDGDLLSVQAPSWRPDLLDGVDLVEEVARLRGYEHIPSVLPVAPVGRGLTRGQRMRRSVARALAERGFVEVLSHPFVEVSVHDAFGLPADDGRRRVLRLANPLSDEQPELRTSLLPPLLQTLRRNVGRGFADLALFEIGLVFRPGAVRRTAPLPGVDRRPSDTELDELLDAVPHQPRRLAVVLAGQREPAGWWGPGRGCDFSDALDAARLVADRLGVRLTVSADREHPPWHPGRCALLQGPDGQLFGHAGELHPTVVAALSLPARTCAAELDLDVLIGASGEIRQAEPVSTYPVAKEDVALVVESSVPAASVERALVEGAGELLEEIRLFDVYTGPQVPAGHKSLAYALRLRALDRTLTAEQAAATRDAAVARAGELVGAVLRGA